MPMIHKLIICDLIKKLSKKLSKFISKYSKIC